MVEKTLDKISKLLLCCLVLFVGAQAAFAQQSQGKKKNLLDHKATYYHDRFENRRTSSGERFSQNLYTAAHKTLPLNTIVKVTNKSNGRYVFLKINDRCAGRGVIDLSKIAAKRIRLNGTGNVSVEVLGDEYLDLWEKQDEMYEVFDRSRMNDSLQTRYMDSVMYARENKIQQNFMFTYYVRLTTVSGQQQVKLATMQLPEEYRSKMRAEKVYNENFYYINIGPFLTKDKAESVVNSLKTLYPQAHLVKKKEK